ncbi:MAG: PilZ domain-containing protein [Spirochaetes bacterium]|nr:PilZ domain-containing protein [Spirochaetota bacterium]
MSEEQHAEKRKYIRLPGDFPVWYQTIQEDDISFGKPPSKNISAGGICLQMEEGEPVGTRIHLKFNIPGYEKKIEAKGKVVWMKRVETGKFELGIEFYEINQEDMDAINQLAKSMDL